MDPTTQTNQQLPGMTAPGAPSAMPQGMAGQGDAAQNALLLQAIKAGALGGFGGAQGAPPPASAPPNPILAAPDPSSMTGGMGSQQMAGQGNMQPQMQNMLSQMGGGAAGMPPLLNGMAGAPTGQGTDPVTAALFSQIPGGQ